MLRPDNHSRLRWFLGFWGLELGGLQFPGSGKVDTDVGGGYWPLDLDTPLAQWGGVVSTMGDEGENTFMCDLCQIKYDTAVQLHRHKTKFCVGSAIGDPNR
jgi:hypothetical protein